MRQRPEWVGPRVVSPGLRSLEAKSQAPFSRICRPVSIRPTLGRVTMLRASSRDNGVPGRMHSLLIVPGQRSSFLPNGARRSCSLSRSLVLVSVGGVLKRSTLATTFASGGRLGLPLMLAIGSYGLRMRCLPAVRKECVQVIFAFGQSLQNVPQVGPDVQQVTVSTTDDRVDHRGPLAGLLASHEERALLGRVWSACSPSQTSRRSRIGIASA